MPIPESDRVIYQKQALEEVVCQLQFPTILKIGTEEPAEFQSKIRKEFPIYEESIQEVPAGLPPQIADVISQKLHAGSTGKRYSFRSENNQWSLSLTRDFLALSTTEYTRWEDFRNFFDGPLKALHDVYDPSFYSRIGLRYRDVIVRSKLGLESEPWSSLLKPFVAGILAEDAVKGAVKVAEKEAVINLGDTIGDVRVKHFLATIRDNNEECYVIDADFFANFKTEQQDAFERLDVLNKFAGRLFRWFISDSLYNAMEPKRVN